MITLIFFCTAWPKKPCNSSALVSLAPPFLCCFFVQKRQDTWYLQCLLHHDAALQFCSIDLSSNKANAPLVYSPVPTSLSTDAQTRGNKRRSFDLLRFDRKNVLIDFRIKLGAPQKKSACTMLRFPILRALSWLNIWPAFSQPQPVGWQPCLVGF